MAFGQAAGPPAPAKQVAALEALLAERGFDGFREARHRFGLTQRQAAGRFTRAEADDLQARLEAGEEPDEPVPVIPAGSAAAERAEARRRARDEEAVARIDAEVLATELTNRGWCCIPPTD